MPASTRRARRFGSLRWAHAAGALAVALAIAVAGGPRMARGLVNAALRSIGDSVRGTVTVKSVSGSPLRLRLDIVTLSTPWGDVRCDQATVSPDLAAALRGRAQLRRAEIGACVVEHEHPTLDHEGQPPRDRIARNPLLARARAAATRTRALSLESLTITSDTLPHATLRIVGLDLASNEAEVRATGRVELEAGASVAGPFSFELADELSVTIGEGMTIRRLAALGLPIDRVDLTAQRLTVSGEGPELTGAELCITFEDQTSVRLDGVTLRQPFGARPLLSIAGGDLQLGPAASEALRARVYALLDTVRSPPGNGTPPQAEPPPIAASAQLSTPWARGQDLMSTMPSLLRDASTTLRPLWAERQGDLELTGLRVSGLPGCAKAVASASVSSVGLDGALECDATLMRAGWDAVAARWSFGAAGLPLGWASTSGSIRFEGAADVELTASTVGDEVATVSGTLALRDVAVDASAIAPTPVSGIDVSMRVVATVSNAAVIAPVDSGGPASPLLVARLAGSVNGIELDAELSLDAGVIEFDAGLTQPTTCDSMWRSIPDGMVPRLRAAGVTFSGAARPRVSGEMEFGLLETLDFRTSGFMGDCEIESLGAPYDPRVLNRARYTHEVTEGVTRPLTVGPGSDDYATLDELPSYVPALMYLSEEIAFFDNPGFSEHLIRRALRLNLRNSRYVYGGSTVSQQLVKNLFFDRNKSLSRKLEEAIVVWAMEATVSKVRILELYVNCIEFGPDIYGIVAAARHYFGREARELTPLEAAFLAAIKPAPWEGERYRLRGTSPDTEWWNDRLRTLLDRLVEYGPYVDAEELSVYQPLQIVFETSPVFDPAVHRRIERPKGAAWESLPTARLRLFGAVEPQ